MGGTGPICPFCLKWCAGGGVKDHVKAKHPEKYQKWLKEDKPYWMYDREGNVKEEFKFPE